MDRYDMPAGGRTDGERDFIGALLETLQQIVNRRGRVAPLTDAQTDRRLAGLAGSQAGQMPGYEAVRAMRDMVAPDRQGGQGAAGAPSGGDAAGGSPVERLAARLLEMGLVDADADGGANANGNANVNGTNVPRRPDGYR